MPVIDCAVAVSPDSSVDGSKPTVLFLSVTCTDAQADDENVNYDIEQKVADLGYEDPMVTFLRSNGPRWLFEHFIDPVKIDITNV